MFILNIEFLSVTAALVSMVALLLVFAKLRRLEKRDQTKEVEKRLALLEEELEEYIERSRKRLNVFKRVIDGVDGVIQNIKIAMDDECLDFDDEALGASGKESLEVDKNIMEKEAEIIHIDE